MNRIEFLPRSFVGKDMDGNNIARAHTHTHIINPAHTQHRVLTAAENVHCGVDALHIVTCAQPNSIYSLMTGIAYCCPVQHNSAL
jgi:hypothetical protein